jgi:membrane associated rhomboid family serine protease
MHGGWFHLISNMWFLSVFGDNVEDAMGSVRFGVFYVLCGLSAAGAQMFFDPHSAVPMVGASGAIGGVMGAYAVLYPRAPVHVLIFLGIIFTRVVVPAIIMLGYWFVLQIISGATALGGAATGGVAVWAHVGGFLAGVILIKVFCNPKRLAECRGKRGRTEKWVRRVTT